MLSLEKGGTVYGQGDPTDGLYFIQKGKIQLSVVSEAGKQRLQILKNDPTELRLGRIDQAVILVWGENGRYEEHAALAGGYKLIAEPGELRGGGAIPPVRRQFADVHSQSGHILRNFGNG